jgi:hypothetical protein
VDEGVGHGRLRYGASVGPHGPGEEFCTVGRPARRGTDCSQPAASALTGRPIEYLRI